MRDRPITDEFGPDDPPGRFGIIIDNFGTTANTGYCEWIRFT